MPSALKAFVIISGIVIVIGAILLTVLIILRTGNLAEDDVATPSGPVDLALPADTRVSQVIADGRRLVLLAEDRTGRQFIAVVNSRSGERLSLIRIKPEP